MGVFVGAWGACLAYCLYCKYRLFPLFDANNGVLPCPEIRLSPARVAGEWRGGPTSNQEYDS